MTENLNKQNVPKEETEEEPIVYVIQKDLKGWKFSRRDFLKGAVTTAEIVAVAGTVAGCDKSDTPEVVIVDTPMPTSTPTKTPTPTETPPPQPVAIVDTKKLNVRQGPGSDYDIIGTVKKEDEFVIISRTADYSWYQIDYKGQKGWVFGILLITKNTHQAPIITDIPPTNTPAPTEGTVQPGQTTPLPGEPGEVAPGQTGINFVGPNGETRTMPCGSPIPSGAVCVCNCVTTPHLCTCDSVCTCDRQGGSYWYPN